jgi:hypothetical protein
VLAAVFVAAASSAALIEGFLANGELLSGTLSALAVAVGAKVIVTGLSVRWFAVAGACGALAVSIKQSGVDGFAAVFAWLTLAAAFGFGGERRRHLSGLASLAAGFVAMAAPFIVHGAITGWSRWRYAFIGYRAGSRSALRGANWDLFFETWSRARVVFLPMVFVAVLAVLIATIRGRVGREPVPRWRSPLWLLPLWLVTASLTFASGGQFFPHYWVVLAAPVAVSAAIAVAQWPFSVGVMALGGFAILPAVGSTMAIATLPRDQVPTVASGDARSVKDEEIGRWFAREEQSGETLYIFCASAAAYAQADVDPPFPYLWLDGVNRVPGAKQRLADLLTDPARAPTFVARFQDEELCGVEQGILDELYQPFTTVEGVPIWVRNDRG